MTPSASALSQHYDTMWAESFPAVREGAVEIDPVLERGSADLRRGVTLLFRPSSQVLASIDRFLSELKACEPDQYFYRPDELHVTALSLFTATERHTAFTARIDDYRAAVQDALAGAPPFSVQFRGITASRGAVLVQGFPASAGLEEIRGRLRGSLQSRHLAEGLDRRYRLVTAHCTAARFRKPLARPQEFASILAQHRATDFGKAQVRELSLMTSDWYMSASTQRLIETVLLRPVHDSEQGK
ncbi:MAG TPA: 2'-5' RNA ligase family protein [Verrucomicrobiae bacterium]|nr:2'-5' RNA ligase family protein [Verrucomicrobiae bacterium]